LGQILSTRPDLLPPEFIIELSSLQDDVAPLTEAEVVQVMEEELGVPWEDVFASIDSEPLAAGTIGQVHKATLESGERVVVKVQRPGARDEIMRDLGLLRLFAEKTESREALRRIVDLPAVVEHLSNSLQRELDFEQEAANIDQMRDVLQPFSRLDAPGVHHRFTTKRLLVLELIPGGPVREAPQGPERKEAAGQLLEAFYRQILTDGFFHADPHPGNMLWSDGTIYFLDLGMVGELDPQLDPFSVVGGFVAKNLLTRVRTSADPKRIFYEVQKLEVRANALVEAIERIAGARPGARMQIDVKGTTPLEDTIRRAARA